MMRPGLAHSKPRWHVATQQPRPCRQKPCWHAPRSCPPTHPTHREACNRSASPSRCRPKCTGYIPRRSPCSPPPAPSSSSSSPSLQPGRCGWVEAMSGGGRGGGWREVSAAANAPAAPAGHLPSTAQLHPCRWVDGTPGWRHCCQQPTVQLAPARSTWPALSPLLPPCTLIPPTHLAAPAASMRFLAASVSSMFFSLCSRLRGTSRMPVTQVGASSVSTWRACKDCTGPRGGRQCGCGRKGGRAARRGGMVGGELAESWSCVSWMGLGLERMHACMCA